MNYQARVAEAAEQVRAFAASLDMTEDDRAAAMVIAERVSLYLVPIMLELMASGHVRNGVLVKQCALAIALKQAELAAQMTAELRDEAVAAARS